MGRREGFMTEIQHPIRSSQIKANIQTNEQKNPHLEFKILLKTRFGHEGSLPVQCCLSQTFKKNWKNETMKQNRGAEAVNLKAGWELGLEISICLTSTSTSSSSHAVYLTLVEERVKRLKPHHRPDSREFASFNNLSNVVFEQELNSGASESHRFKICCVKSEPLKGTLQGGCLWKQTF